MFAHHEAHSRPPDAIRQDGTERDKTRRRSTSSDSRSAIRHFWFWFWQIIHSPPRGVSREWGMGHDARQTKQDLSRSRPVLSRCVRQCGMDFSFSAGSDEQTSLGSTVFCDIFVVRLFGFNYSSNHMIGCKAPGIWNGDGFYRDVGMRHFSGWCPTLVYSFVPSYWLLFCR